MNHKRKNNGNVKDKYEFEYCVGEGAFGFVHKARQKDKPSTLVAIKAFKKANKDGEGISFTICREIALLTELNHENIIRLNDIFIEPHNKDIYLVFEYAEYDLLEMLRSHRERLKRKLPEGTIKSILWQLLNGINYLHSNWILHRDLKPSNVLVLGEPCPGIVKIGDFGLARIFQAPMRSLSDNGVVVTIWYRAPELLLGSKHYTKAIDIWAIGCIFAELVNCKPIFPGEERTQKVFQDDQVLKIFKVLGTLTPEQWPDVVRLPDYNQVTGWQQYKYCLREVVKGISDAGFDLLEKMLQYDPNRRISAREALEHPYFKEAPAPLVNAFSYLPHFQDYYPPRQDIKAAKRRAEEVPPQAQQQMQGQQPVQQRQPTRR